MNRFAVSPTPLEEKALVALGRAISELRREKGLTQEELAQRVELHESYISFIESGRRNPTWGTVLRISRGLEVPMSELVQRATKLERKN
jgi:transcriptional regulator with XRE-family HTH domain